MAIGAPGKGWVTCSKLDDSTCTQTHFFRRIWIWRGNDNSWPVCPHTAEYGSGRVMWPAPNGMIYMSLDAKFKWDMVSDERFWMSGPQPMQEPIWWLLPQIEALNLSRIWHMIYQWVLFFTRIEDLKSESQYIIYVMCYSRMCADMG